MVASRPKKLVEILKVIKNEVPVNIISTPIDHNASALGQVNGQVAEAMKFVEQTIIEPLGTEKEQLDYKLRETPSANFEFLRRQVENHGVAP